MNGILRRSRKSSVNSNTQQQRLGDRASSQRQRETLNECSLAATAKKPDVFTDSRGLWSWKGQGVWVSPVVYLQLTCTSPPHTHNKYSSKKFLEHVHSLCIYLQLLLMSCTVDTPFLWVTAPVMELYDSYVQLIKRVGVSGHVHSVWSQLPRKSLVMDDTVKLLGSRII